MSENGEGVVGSYKVPPLPAGQQEECDEYVEYHVDGEIRCVAKRTIYTYPALVDHQLT